MILRIRTIFTYILSLPWSFYVNLRLLPIQIAWKMPILISRKCQLKIGPNAKVILKQVRPRIIKIGFGENDLFDFKYDRTVIFIDGTVEFDGSAVIGPGSQIWVKGVLKIGDGFALTCRSTIAAAYKISFGSNFLMSWGITIMDHDWHHLFNDSNKCINEPLSIDIGNDVWISFGVIVKKGVKLADGTVVASGTKLISSTSEENTVVAEHVKIREINRNVTWRI